MSRQADFVFFDLPWKELIPEFIEVVIKIDLKKIWIFYNPLTTIHDLQEFQKVEQVLTYYIQRNSHGTLTFQLIIG